MAAAEVIVNALLSHSGHITVYIPRYALSAGLIIALVGQNIITEENAFLGPADPQLSLRFTTISAVNLKKFTERVTSGKLSWIRDLCSLLLPWAATCITRAMTLVEKICVARNWEPEEVRYLWAEFFEGKYNHDQPIFYNEAKKTLPLLSQKDDRELYDLFVAHTSSKSSPKAAMF